MSVQGAWALGTLITTDGTTIQASRTLIIRHAEEIQIVTQVKYGTPAEQFIWLLPIPNHNRPVDEGVRAEAFPSAALDELDAAHGLFYGAPAMACQPAWPKVLLAESFGPGLDMRPLNSTMRPRSLPVSSIATSKGRD